MAAELMPGTIGGVGGAGDCAFQALMGAKGSGAFALQAVSGATAFTNTREGWKCTQAVQMARRAIPHLWRQLSSRPEERCKFWHASMMPNLLATLAAVSKRRGRRRSRAVRQALRRRAPDASPTWAGGDGACELTHVRAPSETPAAHKNGNWSDESLQAAMNAVTDNGMPLKQIGRSFGVPCTSLRDYLYGKTRGQHRGITPTLKSHEEKKN